MSETERTIVPSYADPEVEAALEAVRAVRSVTDAADPRPRYFIRTFGCQQNEADSERLAGLCSAMGYEKTDVPGEADLILVNTCAVREHAEKKALSVIGQYKHVKEEKPSAVIGVGGCMVSQPARAEKLKKSYPYVSFTFDTGAIAAVPSLVLGAIRGGKRTFLLSDEWKIAEGVPIRRESRHMAWLSIMYGCDNYCSYCIVPYVRGRERSRSVEAILDEAKALIEDGTRDITLLGQNVNSYRGRNGEDIAELMHRICALPGDFQLRFMTSHPKDASDRLIEAMATEEKIVKHFHLPIQSGSDRILKRMNRKYDRAAYLERIDRLREAVPDVSVTSDVIVGFPGETEEDFEDTLSVMEKVSYDMVFSFIYSPRAGTPAASFPDQIPHEVAAGRMERLLALGDAVSKERNDRFLGRVLRVLTEGVSKQDGEMLTGRGAPVRPIHFRGNPSLIGQFVQVRITGNDTFCLRGELV